MGKNHLNSMESNPELELAYQYVTETNRHLFLTGKAGTGKTTFLHRIREEIPKRMVVVAPTGVAAINAKGMTIHSLFQLPFGVLTPERTRLEMGKRGFTRKKMDLFRSLDLLVIDEISMVRADVLDAIDVVLRRFRNGNRPFGGVQLLMIGDLHQLPPVVRDDDWYQLRDTYDTPYFFGSKALEKAPSTVVQLKHIYRQSDDTFISLLNKVRNNRIDDEVLKQLNARYDPEFGEREGYITLSSHNATAQAINDEKLDKLPGRPRTFKAVITGDFPPSMYPNDEELSFKVGAQVMFNRNDTYPDRLYYNGKIGTITEIKGDEIVVDCPDQDPIVVLPVTWENRKFELDPKTKAIEERVVGTYEQHPLKLAWAITIHKSQGLTFDRVIIDAQAAFAHGQVYVALSRCKTFEGIVLRTPIQMSSVRTDTVVRNYTERAEANSPTPEHLHSDKRAYQTELLRELFGFPAAEVALRRLERTLLENEKIIQGDGLADFRELRTEAEGKIITIAHRFLPQLERYCRQSPLPENNQDLDERLTGAATYFVRELEDKSLPRIRDFAVLTNNESVGQLIDERRREVERALFIKLRAFTSVIGGFVPMALVKAKADAHIDFEKGRTQRPKTVKIPKNLTHRELYEQLVEWRREQTLEQDVPAYQILPNGALISLAEQLPTGKKGMLAIKGFGKKRFDRYGAELTEIITRYLENKGLDPALFKDRETPKRSRGDSRLQSLEAFRSGKSVAEIAAERGLVESTIFTHLYFWMKEGDIQPRELVAEKTIDAILEKMIPHETLAELKAHLDDRFTYHELRVADWVWRSINEEEINA